MKHRTSNRVLRYFLALWASSIPVFFGVLSLEGAGAQGTLPMEIGAGVTGFWITPASSRQNLSGGWKAHWIWMDPEIDSNVMLARGAFSLDFVPRQARLRITATSQYELYVNAQYVTRGPARTAPHHQSFDEFEISRLLSRGKNVVSVRVHFQEKGVSYHHQKRPGLLVQLDFLPENAAGPILSGKGWKVHPDSSWEGAAPLMSRFHLEVCDRVDLRQEVDGWTSVEFDDKSWADATPLMREVGWPGPPENANPQVLTPPWTALIQRDLPYLRETVVRGTKLIEATTIGSRQDASFPLTRSIDQMIAPQLPRNGRGLGTVLIPEPRAGVRWFLLFDFEEVLNGRPMLDIEGPEGAVVRVHCAPYVLEDQFTAQIVDSQLIDRVVLSGRRDRWEATYFKPTRFLGIEISSVGGPVKLHFAGIRQVSYPFERRGTFKAPEDQWLEKVWEAAATTIRVCTTDAYTDNYRERRQYAQTGYYAALGNAWVFGDTALQRRYLRQIAQEQEANGLMPAYAPLNGDDYMVILDSNLLWVRGLRNYLLFSGDEATVRDLLPSARKLLDLLLGYTDNNGLLNDPPYAYWIDHAQMDRRGSNFALNAHFLGTLEDFAEVLDWLSEPDAAFFQLKADQLRASLREQFWNPERRLFSDALIDGRQSEMFSEHANGLALAMSIPSTEQAEAIAKQLLSEEPNDYIRNAAGITMVTPAMSYFLHQGLSRSGYVRQSLALFKARFGKMLQPNLNQTLWEEWWLDGTGRSGRFTGGRTRSDAQTESAFPPALFGEFLLGVQPVKPGLREVLLSRPDSGVDEVEGALPSPSGVLSVHWKLAGEKPGLDLGVPADMTVKLDLKSLGLGTEAILFIDDQAVDLASITTGFVSLGEGDHRIRF